ncbi:MAG TPA: hypothetical protein QF861_13065 [Alphaproteobacteria bacterium]|nr:hypothetical protein [Alphaproteobacteria bacterium]
MTDSMIPNTPQDEVSRLMQAAGDALTDSMVERLSITVSNALEVVDKLNDEDTKDAILTALDRLGELHRIGALGTLFDTVALLHAARSASTDNIVERLFTFIEHMLNTVGNENLASLVDDARMALDEAVEETANRPVSGGMLATLSMLGKPECQRALQFMLCFTDKLQSRQRDQG